MNHTAVDPSQPRHGQYPGPHAAAAVAVVALHAAWSRPKGALATVLAGCTAYAFTDFYLNVLHMFLDKEENMTHALPQIRVLAESFQEHHSDTTFTFRENHMADIDMLIFTVASTFIAWSALAWLTRRSLPRSLALWTLLVCLFGELAIYNHSLMHARTHGIGIPGWARYLQDLGVLPSPTFHRVHHTTFVENYAFLVGAGSLYDGIPSRLDYSRLHALFWMAQPHTVISAVSACSLLYAARPQFARPKVA